MLAAGTAAVGPAWWMQDYAALAITQPTVLGSLAVQALFVLTVLALRPQLWRPILLTQTPALAVAVALRVIVETAADPTRHNLWPLEVGAALLLGICFVVPAGLIGGWIGRRRGGPHR